MEKPVWKASAQGPVSTECSDAAAGVWRLFSGTTVRCKGGRSKLSGPPPAPAVTGDAVNACHRSDELN